MTCVGRELYCTNALTVSQVITDYYGMITHSPDNETPSSATPSVDHVTSHDKSATPLLSLTATLRMSIAGEEMEGASSDVNEPHPPPIQGEPPLMMS